ENATDPTTVNEAFIDACRFHHEAIASLLLDRAIDLDPELGKHVDDNVGRAAFIQEFIEKTPVDRGHSTALGPWKTFVMGRVRNALHDGDLPLFVDGLRRDPWLLGEDYIDFQRILIENAAVIGRPQFIAMLFDLHPAILRRQPPPRSQAI